MSIRPDTASVIDGLKDFQRATVDYVFERFYGPQPTKRFLVADEVGLGKTLVARGVIARTIDHLWKHERSIDVIYICSNADIARQNIQRLQIPDCNDAAQATRLTLLPLQSRAARDGRGHHRVNFVALTPTTSFEQTGGGGRIDERVLLYWLLDRAWGIRGSLSSLYVLQDYASADSFQGRLNTFDDKISRGELWVDDQIAGEFKASLISRVNEDQAAGKPNLRSRFDELRKIFCRIDSRPPEGATKLRTQWIGELRRLLARVCLSALKPDLIIMDEFQRFKHLLDADSEAGELARDLFDSEAGQGAKVLLLSATPYRGLSLHHEADDDHYGDFLALLGFLEDGNASGCKEVLAEYRAALPTVMTSHGQARLRNAKTALEKRLRRVMARTERLASDVQRGGMLLDAPPAAASLKAADIRAFLGAQRIADVVEQGDVMEYWKSSPYLFNFMDTYALKQAFESTEKKQDLVRLVREFPEAFLDLERARSYQALEPANARLRALLADTVDRGMWRLLWVPPTIGYYQAAGPFAAPELQKVTKRLVFSAWHMVPRAVASLVSYEAERRMMRSARPRAQLTQEDWKKQRGLLRFGVAAERLTGLPLFLLVYPCLTFAKRCDPRELARGEFLTANEVRSRFAEGIRGLVRKMGIIHEPSGSADERWYWLAPMLLDFASFPHTMQEWWERPDLSQTWAGLEASEEDAGWARHVGQAFKTLSEVRSGIVRLGMPPSDLFDVLGIAASAAPATAALRTYIRATSSDPERCSPFLDIAARTGKAFLTLFNHTEVIETVHTEYPGEPYWERVLEYTHAGGLQAVLDEYAHLLKESLPTEWWRVLAARRSRFW